MPTTTCSCGQELHYSADKVGLIARCRCGRPVRLPEAQPEPPQKTDKELFEEEKRAANRQRQFLAVLAFAVIVIATVMIFARVSSTPPARRQQPRAPEAVEP